MNVFLIALFAIPALSLIVWHFAFLMAVNKRFEDQRQAQRVSARPLR